MAYIGNVPAEKYIALTQQTFSTPTGTSFTLSQAVTNSVDIDLYIDNVKQDPTTYSVSGTALTTSTISSPSTMYCIYNGKAMQTVNPPDGSVGTATVTDDAITLAKLAPGTDGNIISFDASGNPVAIATGTDGQVLTSTGAGSPPAFEAIPASGLTSYINTFTYDQSTTGSTAITGVGFTPTLLIAHTLQNGTMEASIGFGNAGNEHALRFDHHDNPHFIGYSDYIGQILEGSSNNSRWAIASFDADGFTYTKTKTGSPTGTVRVLYLAMK